MGKAPYLNAALTALRNQLREMYPDIVIGWIANKEHSSTSDHQPDPDGSVDAIDPMLGPNFTHDDAQELWETIIAHKDKRCYYMIWNHRIVSSHVVDGYPAWEPRPYDGDDPHTNHAHLSSDQRYETQSQKWDLTMDLSDASIAKIVDRTADEVERRLALSKLGGRTVGGSLNNLVDWGLADHPVDKPTTK